jgi:hypothetical protein
MNDQLDRAVRSVLTDIISTAPARDEQPLRTVGVEPPPRSGRPYLMVAAAVMAVVGVGGVALVSSRDPGTTPTAAPTGSIPAVSPPEVSDSGPDATSEWPLQLDVGLTPWFEAADPITAEFGPPEAGPAQQRIRCTTWTVTDGTVTCNTLTGEGYLPAVTYPGPNNKYVDISTLHSNIDAATYATNYSQGKDVGYEDAPLPQQDVTISGAPGRLIETPNGIRRVTWSPQPGVLVAVETGPALTRDELLTIASNITPTATLPSIPLVLASTAKDSEGRQAVALGGIINGEICLTTAEGCTQVLHSTPEPDAVAAPAIYAHPTDFGIAGIATGDIAAVRVVHRDGSTTDIPLARQPVGTTQAFALVTDAPVTFIALDASATPIENVEITNIPPSAETVVPTTVSANTTPPST